MDDTPPAPASTLCTSDQRNVTQRDAGLTGSRKRLCVGYLSERILQTPQYYITNNKMSRDINVETSGVCRVAPSSRTSASVCGGVQTGPVPDALGMSVRGSFASAAPDSRGQSSDLSKRSVIPYEEMVSVSFQVNSATVWLR